MSQKIVFSSAFSGVGANTVLSLSQAQLSLLADSQIQRLAEKLCAFLQENFPEREIDTNDNLTVELKPIVNAALALGFDSEQHIAIFVIAAACLGRNFHEAIPEMQMILEDEFRSPDEKIILIEKMTISVVDQLGA